MVGKEPQLLQMEKNQLIERLLNMRVFVKNDINQLEIIQKQPSLLVEQPGLESKLQRIVDSVPMQQKRCRILGVGRGTGCLIPHFLRRGWKDVLAVDVSPSMLKQVEQVYGEHSTLGNDVGVRCWQGDVAYLPDFQGPFDSAFFNAVCGNFHDQQKSLLKVVLQLRPGGYLVVNHPLGREWNNGFETSEIVPQTLPDQEHWNRVIQELPLELVHYVDDPDFYCTLLQVPEEYKLRKPLQLGGMVVEGFGRGSKQMGVPTANINPPEWLQVPLGVYFGWAQLRTSGQDSVEKMVMNIGKRPTIDDGEMITVEAHIMHDYNRDFHGEMLDLLAIGFIRPEMKFNGLQELIQRIQKDIAIARNQLDGMETPIAIGLDTLEG